MLPRFIFRRKLVFEINGIAHEEQRLKGHSLFNRISASAIQKAEKMAARYSDRIVAVTPHIASYFVQDLQCQSGKIEVVSNGVNTKIFHPIPNEESLADLRRKLGIRESEIVLIFVGNLAPWQGVEYLIEVAPSLLKKFESIRFLVIGSGILKKDLEEEANRLGVSGHFIFTGMIDYDEIPLYVNIADICLVLKRRLRSGYSPVKLYEYMACGKPVLSSRVEGLEFIETEGLGRLVEPENGASLEEGLCDLLRDSQRRKEMGVKGLQLAREKFDWESKVVEIERILCELA